MRYKKRVLNEYFLSVILILLFILFVFSSSARFFGDSKSNTGYIVKEQNINLNVQKKIESTSSTQNTLTPTNEIGIHSGINMQKEQINFSGYIVELKDKPTLNKKAELETNLKKLKLQLRELKQELANVEKSNNAENINSKRVKIISIQNAINDEENMLRIILKDYRDDILSKRLLNKKQLVGILKDPRKIKQEYKDAFNGFYIDMRDEEAEKVKRLDFIKKIWPNVKVKALLYDSVPLINADDVWALGYTGKGVTIGIIDTGVDYTHVDLGACSQEQFLQGLCNKVKEGYDFVNTDNNPMDDNGHGTHVAATAGGNGILKGIAPDSVIYAYKVLNSGGSGYESDIISAIDNFYCS